MRLRLQILKPFLITLTIIKLGFYPQGVNGQDSETEKPKWNMTTARKLRSDLLKFHHIKYMSFDAKVPVGVNLTLDITNVYVDYATSGAHVTAMFLLEWRNDNFKWSPNDYGDLDSIHFSQWEIWKPHFSDGYVSQFSHQLFWSTNLIVYHNGNVKWEPAGKLKADCELDILLWPFDEISCSFSLHLDPSTSGYIDINVIGKKDQKNHRIQDTKYGWKLTHISSSVSSNVNRKVRIKYYIRITKVNYSINSLIYTSSSVVCILLLSVLCLPIGMTDKIFFTGFSTLIACLFLIFFSLKVPVFSAELPKVVTFYIYLICLCSFYFIILTLLYNISTNDRFRKKISKILFLMPLRQKFFVKNDTQNLIENTVNNNE